MTYSFITRTRAKNAGKEIDTLLDEDDVRYSERLPYPEASRQRLYERILDVEEEFSSRGIKK